MEIDIPPTSFLIRKTNRKTNAEIRSLAIEKLCSNLLFSNRSVKQVINHQKVSVNKSKSPPINIPPLIINFIKILKLLQQ